MFRRLLTTSTIDELTVIAFAIFFAVFLIAAVWTLCLPRERVRRLSQLPLESDQMNDRPDSNIPEPPIDVADLRPHVFDGIQEYDKHMPNWWLWTFYVAIIFSIGYWIIVHMLHVGDEPGLTLEVRMREAREAAVKNAPELSDAKLWAMSLDAGVIAQGKTTFETTCASCHRPDLGGMIGPNLKDQEWVHGGKPMDVVKIINEGFLAKGMPPWGQMLGQKKISEVAAYILSFHQDGEPVTIKPWVSTMGGAPAPAPQAGD